MKVDAGYLHPVCDFLALESMLCFVICLTAPKEVFHTILLRDAQGSDVPAMQSRGRVSDYLYR